MQLTIELPFVKYAEDYHDLQYFLWDLILLTKDNEIQMKEFSTTCDIWYWGVYYKHKVPSREDVLKLIGIEDKYLEY